MSAVPSEFSPAVVSRLRAAGCVFAEDEARLLYGAATSPAELDALVERRAAGLPLEQVLGWAGFAGLRIAVAPGVFVPRRRTELLAGQPVRLAGRLPAPLVVDLCCGSGAVAAAVAAALPAAVVHAADLDPAAVRCARRNLDPARVHEGDLYGALPAALRGRVDVLVANTPYVPSGLIDLLPREARIHEPRLALDGGPDGLDVLRRVVAGAPGWLAPGGHLLVETSADQAALVAAIVAGAGLRPRQLHDADLDATMVRARVVPPPAIRPPAIGAAAVQAPVVGAAVRRALG